MVIDGEMRFRSLYERFRTNYQRVKYIKIKKYARFELALMTLSFINITVDISFLKRERERTVNFSRYSFQSVTAFLGVQRLGPFARF
jgi:hypothetical protein